MTNDQAVDLQKTTINWWYIMRWHIPGALSWVYYFSKTTSEKSLIQ
ncbi:MAG: hypothetical protein U0K39_01605 [Latilactobacillus curvatus]|nr:hypothetical protein [Latilactobacillus curvatus]